MSIILDFFNVSKSSIFLAKNDPVNPMAFTAIPLYFSYFLTIIIINSDVIIRLCFKVETLSIEHPQASIKIV